MEKQNFQDIRWLSPGPTYSELYAYIHVKFSFHDVMLSVHRSFSEENQILNGIPKKDYTCFDCLGSDTCPYAFDAYNTSGECLASK